MTPKDGDTIVVWFSCGAASAIALRETLRLYGGRCTVLAVNNPVLEEHEDNRRFGADVAERYGCYIEWFTAPRYPNASAQEVWDRERFMSGPGGAKCTVELKKAARAAYQRTHKIDWHVFGFTADERRRHDRFVASELPNVLPVLIDAGLTKQACYDELVKDGIRPPIMYELGFPNANCKGCVKATSPTYWNHTRLRFPDVFEARVVTSRELGVRLVEVGKERIFLDELDPNETRGAPLKSMAIECGVMCGEEYWRDAD